MCVCVASVCVVHTSPPITAFRFYEWIKDFQDNNLPAFGEIIYFRQDSFLFYFTRVVYIYKMVICGLWPSGTNNVTLQRLLLPLFYSPASAVFVISRETRLTYIFHNWPWRMFLSHFWHVLLRSLWRRDRNFTRPFAFLYFSRGETKHERSRL
jgi:hypothetical protein